MKTKIERIYWTAIIVTALALLFGLAGCKNTVITIPRQNLKPVKIVDQRALWDTRARDMYVYVDPNTVHIEVGQVRSVSDANSIEAAGTAAGKLVNTAVKGF